MRAYTLTKQAFKTLTALAKNDLKTAKKTKESHRKIKTRLNQR
jgi:hypothetical protein